MSERPTPSPDLLFGALAVQMRFVTADTLAAHLTGAGALAERLTATGALTPGRRRAVELAVAEHLAAHAGNAETTLASLWIEPDLHRRLRETAADSTRPMPARTATIAADGALPTPQPQAATGDPQRRDRYRIVRHHADGGLGRVSVAYDGELRREVALKEILPEHRGNAQARSRFVREGRTTGCLEHPGIVPVHGLGTHGGDPFYAMRFVRGESLGEAIRGFHARIFPGAAERNLAFRELLARFTAVCDAVHYAHSRGVVHRDLKPANVMLGKYGETLVVDWGLAKAMGSADPESIELPVNDDVVGTAETRAGSALGTPSYMSPEQADGRPDLLAPAADVYALGGVLVTLLAGRLPVAGDTVADTLAKVRRGDTLAAGPCPEGVPEPLWTVCRKAMSHAIADRYATAADLAAEVDRWLADEPVLAHAESLAARVRRWLRQHPATSAGVASAVLLALLFAAAGLLVVGGYNRTLAEQKSRLADRNDALAAAVGAEQAARRQAEANLATARDAVDRYLREVTDDRELKNRGLFELRTRLLQAAVPFYERLGRAGDADDPADVAGRARAQRRLGDLHRQTGDADAAARAYRSAQDAFGRLHANDRAAPRYRGGLAVVEHNLALLLMDRGDAAGAEATCRNSLEMWRRLAGDFPQVPEYRSSLAQSHNNLGALLAGRGDAAEANAAYGQALALRQRLADDSPEAPAHRSDLAESHRNLGNLLAGQGDAAGSEAAYRRALEIEERLAADFQESPEYRSGLADSLNDFGLLLTDHGNTTEAERAYRRALELWQALVADFPAVPAYRSGVATGHHTLAVLLAERGDAVGAETDDRRALELREQLAADFPTMPAYRSGLAYSNNGLGTLLARSDADGAETAYRRALELRERLAADFPTDPDYRNGAADSHNDLGILLAGNGDAAAAETHLRRSAAVRQRLVADFPERPQYRGDLAASHTNLAGLLVGRGDTAGAEANWRRAIRIGERLVADVPGAVEYQVGLGATYLNLASLIFRDRSHEAFGCYRRSVATLRGVLRRQPSHDKARRFLSHAHSNRANALAALGQPALAAADFGRAAAVDAARGASLLTNAARQLFEAGQSRLAVATAESVLATAEAGANVRYDLACLFALCVPQGDGTWHVGHAERAMSLLDELLQAHRFADPRWAERLRTDTELDSLRQRTDFRELLANAEAPQ